jgi:hypothetical protein
MFQYAFGQSLAQEHKTQVVFDTTELLDRSPKQNFTYRNFELDIFEGQVAIAPSKMLSLFIYQPEFLAERIYYRALRKLKKVQFYKETGLFMYDPEVWRTSPNTYFDGYWQNEKYFKRHEQLIRRCFTFKAPLFGNNQLLANQIQAENSIAVHVRRGDYASNQQVNSVHGVCSIEYYQAAVCFIAEKLTDPKLYIFSDEPEWVAQNMTFDYPVTYVSHNTGDSSFEDMRLMSLCKHNIIANSSFSWWGAWLNNNPKKMVVAPQRWMQNTNVDTSDLVPEAWMRI